MIFGVLTMRHLDVDIDASLQPNSWILEDERDINVHVGSSKIVSMG